MLVLRRRYAAPVIAAVAVVLGLAGLAQPAEAGIARTISLRASAPAALAGTPVIVAGTLTSSPKGSSVVIQQQVGRSWLPIRRTATRTASGAYRIDLLLPATPGSYRYRAFAPSGGGRNTAVSAAITLRSQYKVSASIKASPTTVAVGGTTRLTGRISRANPGTTVRIDRYNGVGWTKLTAVRLTSANTFSKLVTVRATFSYRVVSPSNGLNAAATSGGVRVSVPSGPPAPAITTTSLPTARTGSAYSELIRSNAGAGKYSIVSGALPPGLTLSSGGRVSGTPSKVGTFAVKVGFVASSSGRGVIQQVWLAVTSAPVITTTSLPAGSRGTPYAASLEKNGKAGVWSVSAGALPTGITLTPSTGELSGTPTVDGTFPVTFTFTQTADGQSDSASLPLVVADPPDPVITTTTLPEGEVGSSYGPVTLARTGNAGVWTLGAGSLPSGITLSSGGVLSGTPSQAGDFPLTVTFTEANGTTDDQDLLLHVSAVGAPVISASLPVGHVGQPYSGQLSATPGTIGPAWSVVSGSLPAGLTLNANTGAITGTPTTAGEVFFIVKYQVFLGGSNTKYLSIRVDPA